MHITRKIIRTAFLREQLQLITMQIDKLHATEGAFRAELTALEQSMASPAIDQFIEWADSEDRRHSTLDLDQILHEMKKVYDVDEAYISIFEKTDAKRRWYGCEVVTAIRSEMNRATNTDPL